jgi:glycine/D-amino acid oxidase-like deaminating enzyme
MIDYLIVGGGIAGLCFAELCLQNGKTFMLITDDSQNSSKIAGGLYNPVILKRFTGLEDAGLQLDFLDAFYTQIEKRTGIRINHPLPLLRKFFSIEEQNNWYQAADQPKMSPFLSTIIEKKEIPGIEAPYNYGRVFRTGYLDTALFLKSYHSFLQESEVLLHQTFDYQQMHIADDCISYQSTCAKNIVFAEGFGLHANPFFSYLPLDGTKGELFIIKAPDLKLDDIINTSVFILPLGNSIFKVGATYNWQDKTDLPTEEGKEELVVRIKEILHCDFEIISHYAGVRPTVKDRKPLLGSHEVHKNLFVLNGLGTRGVMLGPYSARMLFEYCENGTTIPMHYSINRFRK